MTRPVHHHHSVMIMGGWCWTDCVLSSSWHSIRCQPVGSSDCRGTFSGPMMTNGGAHVLLVSFTDICAVPTTIHAFPTLSKWVFSSYELRIDLTWMPLSVQQERSVSTSLWHILKLTELSKSCYHSYRYRFVFVCRKHVVNNQFASYRQTRIYWCCSSCSNV